MKTAICFVSMIVGLIVALQPAAYAQGVTKPVQIISKIVTGMPTTAEQEVRVFTAEFKPGEETVFHTHRYPVTVYILEGTFTLELEGAKAPIVIKAGDSYVEPAHLKMVGYNRSPTSPLRLVIFYVSEKGAPFLDMLNAAPDKPGMKH